MDKDRSTATKERRQAKLDGLFKGKRFVVVGPIDLKGNEVFKTPMGNHGQQGWLVEQEDDSSVKYCVGERLLKLMHDQYGAVDLPDSES